MAVKPGYKLTEVGVIPQEWETCQLSDISRKITDGDHVTPKRVRHGYYLLSARNILNGTIDVSDVDYIGTDEYLRMKQRCGPEAGDILISCSGTVGRVTVVPFGFECVLVRSAALAKLDRARADSFYIQYWLQSHQGQGQISNSVNQGAQPNLFLNHIERLRCPNPPLPEQRAVAEALSDVDGLLRGLDRLITKKRDLKQAAMQQLLTGQTRLPGFHGEWKSWAISQIAPNIIDYRGRTPLKLGMEWGGGDIPALSARNVKMGYIDFREETYYGSDALYKRWMTNCDARCGDVVITTEAPLGNVALIPDDRKYILSQRTVLLQVEPLITISQFLKQAMMAKQFQNLLSENSSGSTATGIQRKRFEKLELMLPEVPEQIAIGYVLSDMDAELAALEQWREKTRDLKQAMMQELLTGKTRLLAPGGSQCLNNPDPNA